MRLRAIMRLRTTVWALALSGILSGVAAAGPALAEAKLSAISAFPKQLLFTQQYLEFIESLNKANGPVKINFVGGPEVTPVRQQGTAIRNGAFDMLMGPPAYYQGAVPEGFALFGANVTPQEARANGGIELMDKIFGEKLNAKFLAWGSGGVGFHIYLAKEPARTDKGGIDLSGFKLRSAPPYRQWFTSLGATNVMMQASEIYTALERKVVDGFGWPSIGFTDLGLHKFVKYRVEPQVWQMDIVIIMNRDRWNKLSEAEQKFLQDQAIAFEKASAEAFSKRASEDRAKLLEAGAKFIELEGAARDQYVSHAHGLPWARIKEIAPENYEALRAKFYKP